MASSRLGGLLLGRTTPFKMMWYSLALGLGYRGYEPGEPKSLAPPKVSSYTGHVISWPPASLSTGNKAVAHLEADEVHRIKIIPI